MDLFDTDDLGQDTALFEATSFEVVDAEATETLLLDHAAKAAAAEPVADAPRNMPSHLSPSSASTFDQCSRRWKFRYIDRLADPPGIPALAGTFAHRVLERLFQHPSGQRTTERAKALAREVWPETESDPDFQALELDEKASREFRWKGWKAVEGLWKVEDPTRVSVVATEQQMLTEIGTVPFRGIVDRLDRNPTDGLEIVDYKSGTAPPPRFSADRLAQVLLYAAAVHASTGEQPTRARLIYLGQKEVSVDVTPDELDPVVDAFAQTWNRMQTSCDSGEFEAKTGPLCGWCPYAPVCPEGQAEIRRRVEAGTIRFDAPAIAAIATDD